MTVDAVMRCAGIASVAGCIGVSALMNWHYWSGQGASSLESSLTGAVSVAFDVGKVVAAWVVVEHFAARRYGRGVFASLFVVALVGFSLWTAVSFVAKTRTAVSGGREVVRANFTDTEREIQRTEAGRAALPAARAVKIVETEIGVVLAASVLEGTRVKGNVETVSGACRRPEGKTIEPCQRVADLRLELATAVEAANIEARLIELRRALGGLRDQGGMTDTKPEATLIAKLSRGLLSATEVVMAQSLFFPVLLELWATFGLVVLANPQLRERVRHVVEAAPRVMVMQATWPEAAAKTEAPAAVVAALPPAPTIAAPFRSEAPVQDKSVTVRADIAAKPVPPKSGPLKSNPLKSNPLKSGEPAVFFAEVLQAERGRVVAGDALFPAYKAWCERQGVEALRAKDFVEKFKRECGNRRVEWAERADAPVMVDWRLV